MRGERVYEIARRAGLHPQQVSQVLNGSVRLRVNDPRALKIAAAVGVPAAQALEERSCE